MKVSWNASSKELELKTRELKDFNTDATHNYTIALSLQEIAAILHELGASACVRSPSNIEAERAGSLKAMVRLIATTSGVGSTTG